MENTSSIALLQNCDCVNRFNRWMETGGTLYKLNENETEKEAKKYWRQIGCGINSLVFLGIFTREQGTTILPHINKQKGTTFSEIMEYVFMKNENLLNKYIYSEVIYSINSFENIKKFYNYLYNILPLNTCTIIKLNRDPTDSICSGYKGTGHTIIISKDANGIIYTIDPQGETIRQRISEKTDTKIFESFQSNCFNTVSMMHVKIDGTDSPNTIIFDSEQIDIPRDLSPYISKKIEVVKYKEPILYIPDDGLKFLYINTTQTEFDKWVSLYTMCPRNTDCAINVLSILNIITRKNAMELAYLKNKYNSIGTTTPEIIFILNSVFPEYEHIFHKITIDYIINYLPFNTSVIILLKSLGTSENGHAMIISNVDGNLQLLDPQSQSGIYFMSPDSFDAYLKSIGLDINKMFSFTREKKQSSRKMNNTRKRKISVNIIRKSSKSKSRKRGKINSSLSKSLSI
jgi:hypothetical protein